MNAQADQKQPVIKRESKNRIRVEFDRTPLKERLKAKFFNSYFLTRVAVWIFRLVLLVGISYVILYPFFAKIAGSFMAPEDFQDVTVRMIPKTFSLNIYKAIFNDLGYWKAFGSTFALSFICGILQTFVCCLIGYGFAKFKFKGRNLVFFLVILTMIVPHQTLQLSMYMEFRYFDILGIVRLFKGGGIQIFGWNIKDIGPGVAAFFEKLNILPDVLPITKRGIELSSQGINLLNTYTPLIILSLGGLAFKNGLYIFLLRQFFRGMPDELEESAYMDGCGPFRTFIRIILPNSIPMLITVFLFAFCWQWTDDFYTGFLFTSNKTNLLVRLYSEPMPASLGAAGNGPYEMAFRNTIGMMIIFPLIILYAFFQNFLVQGIEHSGIAN